MRPVLTYLATACAAVLTCFSAIPPASPAGEQDPGPRCAKCKSLGRLECPEHPKAECALEDEVLFCSWIADCEVCGGSGFVDCPRCANEAAEAELARRRAQVSARRKALAWIDETMGRAVRKVETEHMITVFEIDRLKVEKRQPSAHELLHIYGARMEQLARDYRSILGAREKDFREKPLVMVWWLPKDQKQASLRFCDQGMVAGVKLMGTHPRYSVCGNRQFFRGDEQLHRNLVHNVTHLLLSHQAPSFWIGNVKGGWADEGLAHWFEDRAFGICDTYCYQEQNTQIGFKGGRYRKAVRAMVAKGNITPAATVFTRNTDTLTPAENALAMSYVDYLMSLDPAKLNRLLAQLRSRVPTRDALKAVFGLSVLEFEARWKDWVLANYPSR